MKNKVFFIIAIVVTIAMCLSACGGGGSGTTNMPTDTGNSADTSAPNAGSSIESDVVDSVTVPTDEPASTVEPDPPEGAAMDPIVTPEPMTVPEIEWTTATMTTTDPDGYTYEITYKVSPWILLSNAEFVNAAWDEIGAGNTLPEFSSWGLQKVNNLYRRSGLTQASGYDYFAHSMTDMYYCMGSVRIKNITDGWSINGGNARSRVTSLLWGSANVYDSYLDNGGADTIGRLFFNNGTSDCAGGITLNASMTQDAWGPVPFILMAPENFSPNHPHGEQYDNMPNGYLCATDEGGLASSVIKYGLDYGEIFRIGVIGEDGIYVPSADN